MAKNVRTVTPSETAGDGRQLLSEHQGSCVPVVDSENQPVGIISSNDFLEDPDDSTPASEIMSEHVYTVPRYGAPSLAARIMRNHGIHHVVVTHEKQVVGLMSSFDLLRLVEDHSFVMKNPPSVSKRKKQGKRRQAEINGMDDK